MLTHIVKRNIATLYLILMCVQYIPLEGSEVSYIKFVAMALSPVLWLFTSPNFSRASLWGGVYFAIVLLSGVLNYTSFRTSTLIYLFTFISTFVMFYNLVWIEAVFSLEYFVKVLKGLIWAYVICLMLQQIVRLAGMGTLPLINLVNADARSVLIGNSLAIEQSHAARILIVLALSLLRMYEVSWGVINVTFSAIYRDAKWLMVFFVWAILSMGSGTAVVGIGILSLYFVKRRYMFRIIPLLVLFYFMVPKIDFEPLQRAMVTFEAALTLDADQVIKADHSAAARVVPLINTIKELDFADTATWIGRGIDSGASAEYLSSSQTIGGITDYGLISYVVALILVFSCAISRFLSLESLLFFTLMGAGVGNIAYQWGVLMIFSTVRYFKELHDEENT